jgi:hypothetical protein
MRARRGPLGGDVFRSAGQMSFVPLVGREMAIRLDDLADARVDTLECVHRVNGAPHFRERREERNQGVSRLPAWADPGASPPGLGVPFTPYFRRPPRRTSGAFHPELRALFTPYFRRFPPRTSAPFPPYLPCPSRRQPSAAAIDVLLQNVLIGGGDLFELHSHADLPVAPGDPARRFDL